MSNNEVNLTFSGDHSDLEDSFDKVGDAADSMAGDVNRSANRMGDAADSFDRVGSAADDVDTKAMGFRDTLTGVADTAKGTSLIMEGDLMGGFLTLGAGVGDLASGIANLGAPMLKTMSTWVTSHATMAASSIATAASAIASWIATAAASVANAAVVAASWLLAFAPVIIVVAIVVALVVVIIKNWDTIKQVIADGWNWIKDKTVEVWDAVYDFVSGIITTVTDFVGDEIDRQLAFFTAIPGFIGDALSTVADAITAPFTTGFSGIKTAWNNTVGGLGFSVPSWVPGIGGKEFRIPTLARGGVVTSPTIAMIGEAGPERVTPLNGPDDPGRGGGPMTLIIRGGGSRWDDLILESLRKSVQNRGGNVQTVVMGRG